MCAGSANTVDRKRECKSKCGWTNGIAALREKALEYDCSHALHTNTFIEAYLLQCHVGMHTDARVTCPEFIVERWMANAAQMSPERREQLYGMRRGLQGCVITPEFGHYWKLRTCRDVGHMVWSHVAHMSSKLSGKEQIQGGAGGGMLTATGTLGLRRLRR